MKFTSRVCFFFLFTGLVFYRCGQHPAPAEARPEKAGEFNQEAVKNQFVKANQLLMQKENDEMDYYAKSHKIPFTRTNSGIRFYVYKPSQSGDSIVPDMQVHMDFKLKLLDGTLCYDSQVEGRKTFVIGQGDAESGLHKGLQYLKRGDKAILLIPSPLAHGLLGDFNKIPPQMPIVYEVQVY